MYYTEFTVQGVGVFPFDMLRYDACFPADQSSAAYMETPTRLEDRLKEVRTINLIKVSKQAHPVATNPHEDRWKSFQWKVTEVGKPRKIDS